jgi:predicted amidohydrolase
MRAAAIQLNSNGDKDRNLEMAERLVARAASEGAGLVVLPEKWNLLAAGPELVAGAEPLDGPTLTASREWARSHGITILAGSSAELSDDPGRSYNTSVLIDADGADLGVYRKVHLFDVDVEGVSYRESDHERPGDEAVVVEIPGGELPAVGLSVCYDVRFPELYRTMALRGAGLFTIPAAFTVPTGRAHWEVMVRARAIESQAFAVAAGQAGEAPPHYSSWGHSMVVAPSGEVLAAAGRETEAIVAAELDPGDRDRARESMPLLDHRRPEAYLERTAH